MMLLKDMAQGLMKAGLLLLFSSWLLAACLAGCSASSADESSPVRAATAEPVAWQEFLKGYNQELLADPVIYSRLPVFQQESGWLGNEPAAEADIAALEEKLGMQLPPSYRAFLLTTNGWGPTGPFIDRLYPAAEVDFFRVQNGDWISAYSSGLGVLPGPSVPDAVYFVYGPKQDVINGRWEYLPNTVQLSPTGDSAVYLLNPRVVFEDGEWEAWFFANWLPGASRYRSFGEMMQAERQLLVDLNEPVG